MTNVRRGLVALLAAGMIVAIAGGALAQTVTPAATPAAAPTVFTFADTQEPSSLNPLVGYEGTDYTFWALNYNLPIEFSAKDFSPDLDHSIVTSVDSSTDGMTFTYHMRSGMEWSDGQPFTANDVAWTLNFYKKYEIANYISDLALMDNAKATDDTTFVMTTSRPTSVYSGATVFMYDYILPEHIWGKYKNTPRAQRNSQTRHRSGRGRTSSPATSKGSRSRSRRTRTTGASRPGSLRPSTRSSTSFTTTRTRRPRRSRTARSTSASSTPGTS